MTAAADHDPRYPWRCWLGGMAWGRFSTLKAAMNSVDHPFRPGAAEVRHTGHGETWHRNRGSWFKTSDRAPRVNV